MIAAQQNSFPAQSLPIKKESRGKRESVRERGYVRSVSGIESSENRAAIEVRVLGQTGLLLWVCVKLAEQGTE